ncbi:TPA: hypothetical protein ACPZRS_004556 [Yersinia enterocolitica]|uniref:hypothetical protein n=1 Tax=Yersiniaceae TaxID=1903411 RepID=UPI0027FE59F9|nr:hypothetical protein [Serratia fonticola]ELI8130076.1 hypothetical protein [Yersinia enterocolitica]MDQ7212789.1 hypothetical protein [Serratia fonticola]HDV7154029.1 hypothetical protein [Yersinia enterocolitica]
MVMTLWWIASFITHLMKVGNVREYGPTKSHLFLMVATLPAGIGVFIYPIVEVIWGDLSLLKVVGYTFLSLAFGGLLGNIIVRGLSATTFGILLVNPLAMICSIAGLIVLVIQYLP